ncbi:MAG: hypothetical protein ACYCPQ_01535 [Elusimicrobiota bacterium]
MADEIPNLKKDGDKKDEKKEALPPTLKDFQKTRIKLNGMGPRTLLERFKSFRKKDLMFILSGLGVLLTAPLAEHLLVGSNPNGGFQQGWDFKNGLGGFGGGGSPYEPGVNGLSPGEAAGGNTDIITPLNSRDPASLILGPEGESQPPVGSPAAPSGNGGESNRTPWKNVLAGAGGNAARAATRSAGLPSVAAPLLGDFVINNRAPAGGSSASYAPSPISASRVPNRAAGNGSLSQVRGSGVTGASPYSMTSGGGGAEGLKNAASEAGGYFNRPTGGAAAGLQKAASVQMPGGGASGGGAGNGAAGADKAAGQDAGKNSKSVGDSLAEKAAEQNQQHAIDLYWKKIEQQQMEPIKLQAKMEEEMMMTPLKAMTGDIAFEIQNMLTPASGSGAGPEFNCSGTKMYDCSDLAYFPPGSVLTYQTQCVNVPAGQLMSCAAASGSQGPVEGLQCLTPVGPSTACKKIASSGKNPGNTGSEGGDAIFGVGNGQSVSAIGDAGAKKVGTDANAILQNLIPLCQAAASAEKPVPHFLGHATSNPYGSDAELIYNPGPPASGAAYDIAKIVYDLSGSPASACGVTGNGQDSAMGQVSLAQKDLNRTHWDYHQIGEIDGSATAAVVKVLCHSLQPCALSQIIADAQKGGPSAADIGTLWNPIAQNLPGNQQGVDSNLSEAQTFLANDPKKLDAQSKLSDANQKLMKSASVINQSSLSGADLSQLQTTLGKPDSPFSQYASGVSGIQEEYQNLVQDSQSEQENWSNAYQTYNSELPTAQAVVSQTQGAITNSYPQAPADIALPLNGFGSGYPSVMNGRIQALASEQTAAQKPDLDAIRAATAEEHDLQLQVSRTQNAFNKAVAKLPTEAADQTQQAVTSQAMESELGPPIGSGK